MCIFIVERDFRISLKGNCTDSLFYQWSRFSHILASLSHQHWPRFKCRKYRHAQETRDIYLKQHDMPMYGSCSWNKQMLYQTPSPLFKAPASLPCTHVSIVEQDCFCAYPYLLACKPQWACSLAQGFEERTVLPTCSLTVKEPESTLCLLTNLHHLNPTEHGGQGSPADSL